MSTHWAMRTVRNGHVKISGCWYKPSEVHQSYDDRLEGKRLLFGRYREFGNHGAYLPFVNLWGTKHEAHCPHFSDENNQCPECQVRPYQVEGGYLPWLFWGIVPQPARKDEE